MPSTDFRIPESQKETFRLITKADQGRLEAILSVLRQLKPSMSLRSSAQVLAKQVEDFDEQTAMNLLGMISSLFSLQEQLGWTSHDLQEKILMTAEADEDLSISNEGRKRLAVFLQEMLLLNDTLGVISKIWSVVTDTEHAYCFSRILTDVRPVFKPNSEKAALFVLLHNLKIAYHQGDDLKEFFVSMTPAELQQLLKILKRAEKKQKNLESLMRGANLPLLEDE